MSESTGASAPSSTPAAAPVATPTEGQVTTPVVDSNDIGDEDLALLAGEESGSVGTPEEKAVKDAQKKVDAAKGAKAKEEAEKQLNKAIHKYKIKVDGEESEWEGSEQDLIRELQLSKKARKEIEKSNGLQKDVAKLLKMLKEDPESVFRDPAIGIDSVEFAKKIIQAQIEKESKSPDQLAREQLELELQELRAEKKRQAEDLQQEMYEREVTRFENKLEEDVQTALASSGLPKTPYILKRMTDVMLSGLDAKKDISPKQALSIVKKEMDRDLKDMFASSGEDLLEQLLGSDNIKKLNKRQLEKIRATKKVQAAEAARPVETGKSSAKKVDEAPRKKMSINEWMRNKK